jgi:anti-sigma28 factor (negative regulator of flagellin synthesis)
MDRSKVGRLRASIQVGRFQTDSETTAERMLDDAERGPGDKSPALASK